MCNAGLSSVFPNRRVAAGSEYWQSMSESFKRGRRPARVGHPRRVATHSANRDATIRSSCTSAAA